jgi:hypothetical protein
MFVSSTGAGIEHDPDLVELLMWLGNQESPSYVGSAEFARMTGSDAEDVDVLGHALERAGLIEASAVYDEGGFYRMSLDGRLELRRLAGLRKDPAARHRFANDAFLRWLYTTAHDQRPITPTGFLTATESRFAGGELSGSELRYALARLTHSGLVNEIDTEPKTVAITIDGIDCVLSGATVSDYLNRTHPGNHYSISGNTNVVAGSQGSVVQNNHNNAFDPAQMLAAVALVQQLSPALTPETGEQQELLAQVRELQAAAAAHVPDRGFMRRIADGVLSTLRGLAHSPDVQRLAIEAVEQGIQSL